MSSRSKKRTAARVASMTRREEGFNNNMTSVELPKYNGLHDHNLRHYFENRRVQGHLHELGLVRARRPPRARARAAPHTHARTHEHMV